jgi:hemerythrin superfamily protein
MARAEVEQPDEVITDAVDLLTRDHRLVDELFASIFQAAPQQIDPLTRRLCKMVRIHTQIEEELFYPTARRTLGEDAMVDEAEHDHAEAKETLTQVESMSSDHGDFRQVLETLRDQIAAHVASEESELFPTIRKARLDLVALGITLSERRDTLMDVLGLHGDDEEGAANMRDVQRPTSNTQRNSQQDSLQGEV